MKHVFILGIFLTFIFVTSEIFASGGFTTISQSIGVGQEDEYPSKVRLVTIEKRVSEFENDGINRPIRYLSDFLTDVLAYQTAILVLFIPLSFDVVSRISDRYRSDIIIKRFQKEKVFLGLIAVLVVNIFCILIFRFSLIESWGANFIVLILALISTILMAYFFRLIFHYTSGISYIKGRLLNEAKQLLK